MKYLVASGLAAAIGFHCASVGAEVKTQANANLRDKGAGLAVAESPTSAYTSAPKSLAEFTFYVDRSKQDRFTLRQVVDKQAERAEVYQLTIERPHKKPVVKTVSQSQADFIQNEAIRVIWDVQYRKPASTQACTPFAKLAIGEESAKVCAENIKATGQTSGLLTSMAQLFD